MKLQVILEKGEVVESWIRFRDAMEQACEPLDLRVTGIVHLRNED